MLWIRIRIRICMFSGLLDPDQAKFVRKTLIPTVLWLLYDFLSLKTVNVSSKSKKTKTFRKKNIFWLASWRSMTKIAGSNYISQRHGSVPKCHGSRNTGSYRHWLTPNVLKMRTKGQLSWYPLPPPPTPHPSCLLSLYPVTGAVEKLFRHFQGEVRYLYFHFMCSVTKVYGGQDKSTSKQTWRS
jgi:hypothetical protein